MDTHRRAGIAILDYRSTHILLVKEKASSKWGIPKGHLKKAENSWQGALRELSEETGLILQRKSYIRKRAPLRVDNNYLYLIQLCHDHHEFTPDPLEIDEIEWRPIIDLKFDLKKYPSKYNMWIRILMRLLRN